MQVTRPVRTARTFCVLLAIASQAASVAGQTASKESRAAAAVHWVPTWGTAQQLIRPAPPAGGRGQAPAALPSTATPSAASLSASVPAPSTATATAPAPTPAPQAATVPAGNTGVSAARVTTLNNQTLRLILRTSIGGHRARVKLSNAFGAAPVRIGAAHVALRAADSSIVPGSDRPLTFTGQRAVTMAPGVVVVSDPVDLDIAPLADLAVSLYFPGDTGQPTSHATALHTSYISGEGDFTAQAQFPVTNTTQAYYWLSSVEVAAPADTFAIVTFGDSITDGARSTTDTNNAWPALLAARLAARKETANIAVVNEGIGGNRLLTDGGGVGALARLDRDVLSHPNAKWLMILEGINDIGALAQAAPGTGATSEDLIWALQQMIERAHTQGLSVIGCTITPYEGAGYYRENGEAIRDAVNRWIRTSGAFDAVVDFEAATRDPNNPKRLRSEFDPGDHLHPNDAGYKAMADAIDLTIFTRKLKAKS
jgi:lysophospholipase L1-like esterase